MNFQRLRYFVVVAEELNFSRAAERLRMAQPPLSYQIKRLEEELGAQLFHRTKRSVRLTEAGRLLLAEARGLLVHAEQTASVVHRVGQGEVGRLTVGFVPSAANRVLPPFCGLSGSGFRASSCCCGRWTPTGCSGAWATGGQTWASCTSRSKKVPWIPG